MHGTIVAHETTAKKRLETTAKKRLGWQDLFPSRRRQPLEGYIDGYEGGVVRGWVWDPTNSDRRIEVRLFVDDRVCADAEASQPRPDLRASGRGDGRYGFSIAAGDRFKEGAFKASRLRVVSTEPERWTIPFAAHARRRRLRLPRPIKLPATPRELVAILTAAEPFPKKVYVIDRLTRTMPNAFSADYVLLAIEFLRVEMIRGMGASPATWHEWFVSWCRQRIIRGQIRRLGALADAAATAQRLVTVSQGRHERS